MKVTILVPIKDYIERACYEALRRQTFTDRAIIIHQLDPLQLDSLPPKNKTLNSVRNRNEMRKAALGTDSTHFLMVDSDTVLPLNALETLLSRDKDIISGWSLMANDKKWIAARWNGDKLCHYYAPEKGIVEVDMSPLGCMLIKREVLEKIKFEDGLEEFIKDGDGKNIYKGITAKFGENAQKSGYKLYMDGDVICQHIRKEQNV